MKKPLKVLIPKSRRMSVSTFNGIPTMSDWMAQRNKQFMLNEAFYRDANLSTWAEQHQLDKAPSDPWSKGLDEA